MRPRDWFSVGVRLIGVWIIQRGCVYFLTMLSEQLTQSSIDRELGTKLHHDTEVIYATGLLLLGFILVYGAERVTKWVYHEPSAGELGDSSTATTDQTE